MNRVFALLPRTGLANRLFTWAHAQIMADELGVRNLVHGWGHVHFGPWLRGEKSKRYYARDFIRTSNRLQLYSDLVAAKLNKRRVIVDPAKNQGWSNVATTYIYQALPDKSDYFRGLRGHETQLRSRLLTSLKPEIRALCENVPDVDVAVHVRRGDFVDANFKLTEDDYFLNTLNKLRGQSRRSLQIAVFSDAFEEELSTILSVPNTHLHTSQSDIVDIFAISRAKIIITSLKSTFGYWAAFLSQGAVILHPDHIYGSLTGGKRFEGTVEDYCLLHGDQRVFE